MHPPHTPAPQPPARTLLKPKGSDWNPRSLSYFSTFGGSSIPAYNGGSERPLLNGHGPAPAECASGTPPAPPLQAPHAEDASCLNGVRPHVLPRSRGPAAATRTVPVPAPRPPPSQHSQYRSLVGLSPPLVPQHSHSRSLVALTPSGALVPQHSHSRSLLDERQLGLPPSPTSRVVTLFLGASDRRFGFSVVGGVDDSEPARIDDIAVGSPADKADLEVGDEILEVNGRSLEDATHTEVIAHIHQCIRSRTICLRVKRRQGSKIAHDLAATANVQDAFVIAVEQQARERLERLSALKKIKPVDMTKLPHQEQEKTSSSNRQQQQQQRPQQQQQQQQQKQQEQEQEQVAPEEDVPSSGAASGGGDGAGRRRRSNGLDPRVPTPLYVTSVPSLASGGPCAPDQRSAPRVDGDDEASRPPPDADGEAYKSGDELELTQEIRGDTTDDDLDDADADTSGRRPRRGRGSRRSGLGRARDDDQRSVRPVSTDRSEDELDRSSSQKFEVEGACLSESGDSLPGTPEKAYGLVSEHGASGQATAPRNREPPPQDCTPHADDSKLPLTASSSGASSSSRKSGGSGGRGGGGDGGSSSEDQRKRAGNGYPLPEGGLLTDSSMISMVEFDPAHREMAVDVPDSFIARTKTPPRYPPPKSSATPHYYNNNYSKKVGAGSGADTPLNGAVLQSAVVVQTPNSQEEENRLLKYEDELRLRREREEEAAMLRSSLRSSQKLQSLASTIYPPPPLQGLDNQAYTHEELVSHSAGASEAPSPRIGELVQSLQRIQQVLQSNGHRINEDVNLVAQLLNNPDFQKVLAVHNKVQETWCAERPPTPVQGGAQELVAQVLEVVQTSSSPDASELVDLLSQHSTEALLYAHDRVADREPASAPAKVMPGEKPIDDLCQYSHPSVKIVRIDKTNEPLGATIRNEGDAVVIGRIVKGGAAEKSGELHEGDEILEVNGVEVRSKSVNDVCDMLAGMTGTLTFIIIPNSFPPTSEVTPSPLPIQTVHVKAHFDYDPEEDLYIPCRELGMSFQKGDILHVISQTDPSWWQAYREGEEDQTLAGLIPSKAFQQQREAMRQTVVGDTAGKEKSKKGKQLLCAKKHHKNKKKKMLYSNYNDDFDNEEILTYEEVALYYPRANCKRPVVLIGPPNIGRHELRQKLMEDRDRFAAAIPHTSRPRRDKEVDGQDYHFISRAQFEEDILQRKFVEHGEFEKAYYGTSLAAIRAIVNMGKICVLNLHALSLKILKNSDLKPFVVFVAPPSLEKLRQKKQRMGEPVKDEELKEIMEKAREMEDQYGHYFDLIIINQDVESAYQQLLHEINMLEREPQWVPATWLMDE